MAAEPSNVIYALHLGDGVYRYVGLTRLGAAARLRQHVKVARQGRVDSPLYRWMRKHGWENVRVDVLEVLATPGELDDREIAWIAKLRGDGCDLLNCTAGGRGMRVINDEVRAKLGYWKGRTFSPEHIARLSGENGSFYGRKHTAETRAKMRANSGPRRPEVAAKISATKLGVPRSEETRRRMSEAMKGRVPSAATRAAVSEACKGRPSASAHLRWHVARDEWSQECAICQFEVSA